MSTQPPAPRYPAQDTQPPADQHAERHDGSGHGHHGGHGLMMMLMCLPMVLIVGFLVVTGTAGAGLFAPALLCMGMMAVMMYLMPGGHGRR